MGDEKNLLLMVGMCRRAGKTVIGTDMVCEFLRKQSEKKSVNGRNNSMDGGNIDVIVLESSDTSPNTHKKISDKCLFYNVKHIRLAAGSEALGKAVGKRAAATVAIADESFCRAILTKLADN